MNSITISGITSQVDQKVLCDLMGMIGQVEHFIFSENFTQLQINYKSECNIHKIIEISKHIQINGVSLIFSEGTLQQNVDKKDLIVDENQMPLKNKQSITSDDIKNFVNEFSSKLKEGMCEFGTQLNEKMVSFWNSQKEKIKKMKTKEVKEMKETKDLNDMKEFEENVDIEENVQVNENIVNIVLNDVNENEILKEDENIVKIDDNENELQNQEQNGKIKRGDCKFLLAIFY